VGAALPARRAGDESNFAFNASSHDYLNSSLLERLRDKGRHRI
jgi:hypothetical protein